MPHNWLLRKMGIKSDREVLKDVLREPNIASAMQTIKRADRVVQELEALERRRRLEHRAG